MLLQHLWVLLMKKGPFYWEYNKQKNGSEKNG